MPDSFSPEKRSWNMSRIRSTNTSIEIKARKYLFSNGFRFKINVKNLPGKPDIVLPKYHTVIFVHGCFWHRHRNCKRATMPKSKQDYWVPKFQRNIDNDIKHKKELKSLGWKVIIIWECEIKKNFETRMKRLLKELLNSNN